MYIVPLGDIEEEFLSSIEQGLRHVYGLEVKRLAGMPEPDYAFDEQRKQYSSAHILRQLIPRVPVDALSLLAITRYDLFIPMLSFVLGQAQLSAPAAVVSLARLHQEFYGLPPDRALLLKRAVKEAVHEVGHTVGLTHCASNLCPMSLSNTVLHVDIKGSNLCNNCAVLVDEKIRNARPARSDSGGAQTRKV